MHYQQSLALSPDNARALAGIAAIDGPDVSDPQRQTYFVSWSEQPPPRRNRRPEAMQPATPGVAAVKLHQLMPEPADA